MTKINRYFVDKLLDPWGGLADVDNLGDAYDSVDLESDEGLRVLIRRDIVPFVRTWNQRGREAARDALRYTLLFEPEKLDRYFWSNLPPFEPGSVVRLFELIWDEVWPGGDLSVGEGESFEIDDDVAKPNSVFRNI